MFEAALRLRNEVEDDYFDEIKRQFNKQCLTKLSFAHSNLQREIQAVRNSFNRCRTAWGAGAVSVPGGERQAVRAGVAGDGRLRREVEAVS